MPEELNGDDKTILILMTSGVREPKRTYAPFYIATAAAYMDMEVEVWFTMEGITLLKKGVAEELELVPGSGVTLRTWIDRAREAGVRFTVCAQALEAEDFGMEDILEDCDVTGAASIVDKVFDVDRVMYF
jgi:predicted peroxiredoxin